MVGTRTITEVMRLPVWLTRIEAESMVPSLRPGQLVWTVALSRRRQLHRGMVVAVDSEELGRRIVKRIVGLPGERLEIKDGRVLVDGQSLDEPYAIPSTRPASFEVPQGHYLLLGDNRLASSDARSWRNPYVDRSEMVGVLLTRNHR